MRLGKAFAAEYDKEACQDFYGDWEDRESKFRDVDLAANEDFFYKAVCKGDDSESVRNIDYRYKTVTIKYYFFYLNKLPDTSVLDVDLLLIILLIIIYDTLCLYNFLIIYFSHQL